MDPSAAWNALGCRLLDNEPSYFLVGLVPGSPRQPSSRTSRDHTGQPRIFCSLYDPRKEGWSFADGRLNALTLCLFFLRALAYDMR